MKKIAIVELGASHDECIYSQVKIIKSLPDIHLTLICNPNLKESIDYFDKVDKKIYVLARGGINHWPDIFKLWNLLRREKFDKVIFNSVHGKKISKLLG